MGSPADKYRTGTDTLMSPMHNLLITAAIANGGILMKPYLMDHAENSGGDVIRKFSPSVAGELMVPNEADALKNLMVQVVNVGTGSALKRIPTRWQERQDLRKSTRQRDPRLVCGLCSGGMIRRSQSA